MNKLFATLALLLLACLLHAQDGYVKFTADSQFKEGKVKIFQGEIVPFLKGAKANRINIIVGNDTITGLSSTLKSYAVVNPTKLNYLSKKDEYIQLRKGVGIVVNISSIDKTDSASVYSESKTQLTKLVNERSATIRKENCGKIIRLVISNAPTIYYSVESLKEFVEPELTPQETLTEANTTTDLKGWAWWYYIIILLGGLVVAFGVWKFIRKRKASISKDEEPIYVQYKNNKTLSDFASEQGIDLDTLLKLNKGVIDKMYDRYNERDRKSVHKDLSNKKLIVGYQKRGGSNTDNTFFSENHNEAIDKEWNNQQESNSPQENFGNHDGLSNQLRKMEDRIIKEVRTCGSSNNNINELNNLNREITELRSEKNKVEDEKQNLANAISQLQRDKANAETNLQNANNEKTKIQDELKELHERVITLDFLKGYAESVYDYLVYCQKVSSDAYNLFQKVSLQYPKQTYAAGQLLMRFQANVNSLPVGNWTQIAQDIKDTGATTNRQLTRSFSQIEGNAERKKEFQRLLFSKVLVKYSSNILILAESFKNIEKFQGATDFANEARSTFGKHITEIVSIAKATELELKHVSLFENWERYMGEVEDSGNERSLPYKDVEGLGKGSISEIISVGVKTFDEDTKTMIIIHS